MNRQLKPVLSFSDQVSLLQSRGLTINDVPFAEEYLSCHNYYRLNVYFKHYLDNANLFSPDISFETIIHHEENDSWFRRKLFYLFEIIELKLRSITAYTMARYSCAEAFSDNSIFRDPNEKNALINLILPSVKSSANVYWHHINTYGGHFPAWVIIEYFSFGQLSRNYKNLNTPIQNAIATEFGQQKTILQNWLHSLTVWRNICAHHGYMLKRNNPVSPKIHSSYGNYINIILNLKNTIFAATSCIRLLLNPKEWNSFRDELSMQESEENTFKLSDYDFPSDWPDILPYR